MSDGEEAHTDELRRSARRRMSNKKSAQKSALEAMKEARRSGRVNRVNLDALHQDVYEEVDEDKYQEMVRQRRDDDFVVDDDGSGYVDHGADIFDDEWEEDEHCGGSAQKSKKDKKGVRKEKKGGLEKFFTATAPARKIKDETIAKLDDDEVLKGLLNEIGNTEDAPLPPSRRSAAGEDSGRNPFKREKSPLIAPRPVKAIKLSQPLRSSPKPPQSNVNSKENKDDFCKSFQKLEESKMERNSVTPPMSDDLDDFDPQPMDDDYGYEANEVSAKLVKEEVVEEEKKVEKKPFTVDSTGWMDTADQPVEGVKNEVVAPGSEPFYVKKLVKRRNQTTGAEEEVEVNAIRVYWIDSFEDPVKHPGTVYMFGRVHKSANEVASCTVMLKDIQRQVFFVPRETRVKKGRDTGEPVTSQDVYNEVIEVMNERFGSTVFKCRNVSKRFVGHSPRPCEDDEIKVLEVLYTSAWGRLPADLSGETFSRVHNTTATALERVLIEREIKGPGWIDFMAYEEANPKVTYADYEFTINLERMMADKIEAMPMLVQVKTPTVRVLALNVVTALNEKKEHEIVMISGLVGDKCHLDSPPVAQAELKPFAIISKPPASAMPIDIKEKLRIQRLDSKVFGFFDVGELKVSLVNSEKTLLCQFLAKLQNLNPDVFIGHDLTAQFAILIQRLDKLKVPQWSRTSRLRRGIALNKIGHGKSAQWEITAGRLLVDSRTAAMELVKSRSYDLTELAANILDVKREAVLPSDVVKAYANSSSLMSLLNWSWTEPWLALRIVVQINAIPLFLQITGIVGGVLSRTLMGGRAERNEWLLLHAFTKAGYVPPDKNLPQFGQHHSQGKKGKESKQKEEESMMDTEMNQDESQDDEGAHGAVTQGRHRPKAQYAGGLVLEPKRGLYDTLILLLDFNSLYPSIIQEFNLCFTTVDIAQKTEELPSVPPSDLREGILPKEIRALVERRRAVKKLMADAPPESRRQYDIRQMALKLTANSMYGCLGFVQSRFYAKPLAALVTSKGREILMMTKERVEKLGYQVIYGDTDSIMINTNSTDLAAARKLGFEIKKNVNECHRLLELELDGVYKRLLLLKKKKYAAVVVDEKGNEKRELKGLDIVRRDWSALAKDEGQAVVELILSSMGREELVAEIDASLKRLRLALDFGEVPLEKFQILKQLTRNPTDYPDVKQQPHAAVAQRLNASGKFQFRHGDIVEGKVQDGTSNSAVQRAYHRTEIEENPEKLKPDILYYLAHQVHPVVSRLCEPIEETDAVRIAEALGLDGSDYRRSVRATTGADGDAALNEVEWTQDFANCDPFTFPCPKCEAKIAIREPIRGEGVNLELSLASCPDCHTQLLPRYLPYLMTRLEEQLAIEVSKHLNSYFRCDDTVCGHRTRMQTFGWSREGVMCPRCHGGIMRKEYTARMLYDQQCFLKQVLDIRAKVDDLKTQEQKRSVQTNPAFPAVVQGAEQLVAMCKQFLKKNAFSTVDLAWLFAPMCAI